MCLPCWSYKDVAFDDEPAEARRYVWDGTKYVLAKVRIQLFPFVSGLFCFAQHGEALAMSRPSPRR